MLSAASESATGLLLIVSRRNVARKIAIAGMEPLERIVEPFRLAGEGIIVVRQQPLRVRQ